MRSAAFLSSSVRSRAAIYSKRFISSPHNAPLCMVQYGVVSYLYQLHMGTLEFERKGRQSPAPLVHRWNADISPLAKDALLRNGMLEEDAIRSTDVCERRITSLVLPDRTSLVLAPGGDDLSVVIVRDDERIRR